MIQAATIREQGDHRFWTCPGCQRTIGEIVGVRLIIIVRRERVLNYPLADDLHMTCNRCGQVSVYRRAASSHADPAA